MTGSAKVRLVVVVLSAGVVIAALATLGAEEQRPSEGVPVDSQSKTDSSSRLRSLPVWMQEVTYESGTPDTPLRAVRPSSGEGAPRPELAGKEKVGTAVQAVEDAIDELRTVDASRKVEVRERAAAQLSGVRAEMWATEAGKLRYTELQQALEEG